MHKVNGNGHQKTFPVIGIRVPAPDKRNFEKRSRTVCLRIEPFLHDALAELSSHVYMTLSSYCMRVLWAHAADQQLLGNRGNHCQRRRA